MNFQSNQKFESYFSEVYLTRWQNIKKALQHSEKQVLRFNHFQKKIESEILEKIKLEKCSYFDDVFWRPTDFKLTKSYNDLYDFYIMDPASIFVAKALTVTSSDKVLDMCAAPGGKSLILAEQMYLDSLSKKMEIEGELISNEYSDSRRDRLLRVMHEYISKDKRLFIHVKGLDGNQYGLRQPEYYDRILTDVPCSGERHLFENEKEMSLWSLRRTENLSVRQYSLASSAWHALKYGGQMVYSTCSISPYENDKVVGKLVKKRKVSILRPDWIQNYSFVEQTEFGYQIMPDNCGFGPMYFSVILKS